MIKQGGGTAQKAVILIHNWADGGLHESAAEAGVLETVDAVDESLRRLGRKVIRLPLDPPFSEAARRLEALPQGALVFNLFEGFPDDPPSEVQIGLLLRSLGLRATGCPPLAMHLGLHKDLCKAFLEARGLPCVPGVALRSRAALDLPLPFPYPAFIKPIASDASHGVSASNVVESDETFRSLAGDLFGRFPSGLLAEPFLSGREFNCSVVEQDGGGKALPPSLVDYSALPPDHPPVLTFQAKWAPDDPVFGQTPTLCPAPVEAAVSARVCVLAREAFAALRCRGYARVDLREDAAGRLNILEVNPNPDFSPSAGLAKQARANGWSYDDLVVAVLDTAERGAPWN